MRTIRASAIENDTPEAASSGPLSQSPMPSKNDPGNDIIVLIDVRRLERECFVRSIELLHPRLVVLGYSSAEEYADAAAGSPKPGAILYNIGSRNLADPDVSAELQALRASAIPVVVLASTDDLDEMIAAWEAGVAGYIPAHLGIEGIVEATRLAVSGGVFLRFESLAKLRNSVVPKASVPPEFQDLTWRQKAVAEALRRGKANKTIAYDLNMCESTVKVHIRNIMRKLKATNRTEAAFKLNAVLPAQDVDG